MRSVVVLLLTTALSRNESRNETKVLNGYLQNASKPYALDREFLYRFPAKKIRPWRVGLGRRVAIIDSGLPAQDEFFWCCAVDNRPKVVTEIETIKPGAPKLRKHSTATCPEDRNMTTLLGRPIISNHLTKSIIFGFFPPLPMTHGGLRLQPPKSSKRRKFSSQRSTLPLAADVDIISIMFRKRLYVHEGRHRVHKAVNVTASREYLRSLARATAWLAERREDRLVDEVPVEEEWTEDDHPDGDPPMLCSVQISAVDGLGVPWSWYRDKFPEDYAIWTDHLRSLRRDGIWLSAPAGNQKVVNQSAVYNWPANDPNVIGVGCYDNISQSPARQRASGLDLLVRTLDTDPFTSYCNTLAVSTSVLIRDVCQMRCGVPQDELLPRCSADFALFAMQDTADVVHDPNSAQRFFVLTPDRLYDYLLHSKRFCKDLVRFPHEKDSLLDSRLPWRSTFFSDDDLVSSWVEPVDLDVFDR